MAEAYRAWYLERMQVSATNAVTVTGNTADVTTHPIPAVTARYVQLHVTTAQTGTSMPAARIYEFETYGITW
jgi:hypothetical protein